MDNSRIGYDKTLFLHVGHFNRLLVSKWDVFKNYKYLHMNKEILTLNI